MVRINSQIIQVTVGPGSPMSSVKWATKKEIIDKTKKPRFIPTEKLNLVAQFVDNNKQTICILGF